MKKTRKKISYNPQKMEWGTDASTAFAKYTTPGQKDVKEGGNLETFKSHFNNSINKVKPSGT